MSGTTQATNADMNAFLRQGQPLKRNNITVVQMNKSKLKFLNKYLSKSQMGVYKSADNCNIYPVDQPHSQYRLKEKFEDLYKRIQKISKNINNQQIKGKLQKRFLVAPNQQIASKKAFIFKNSQTLRNDLIRFRLKSKPTKLLKVQQPQQQTQCILEINTMTENKQESTNNVRILGSNRQRPRLVSISRPIKMSNSIKDYLSVQKIHLKDLQDSIIEKQHNITQKTKVNKMRSSLYSDLVSSLSSQIECNRILPIIIPEKIPEKIPQPKLNSTTIKYNIVTRFKKFQPPFETYFYRDLLWRVGYSNEKILQFPQQYQYKIRVFVGKGNNSRLVKGIIARRPWYQITDKIQQAQFIWTQIKVSSIFWSQLKNNTKNELSKYKKKDQNTEVYLQQEIWTNFEQKVFNKYFYAYKNAEMRMKQNMKFRNKNVIKAWQLSNQGQKKQIKDLSQTKTLFQPFSTSNPINQITKSHQIYKLKVHNHFVNSFLIGNKKALFQTMSDYYTNKGDDVFNYLPLTFHICNGLEDQKYLKFLNYYYIFAKKSNEENKDSKFNAWIVKPGQNTNRGQGITVCLTLQSIKSILKKKDKHNDGSNKTYIIQKYIERPMLYKKRKFDIRHYIMINCSNGYVKGYWFKSGYVRTTSSQYSLKQGSGSVHLTNDAVQKHLPDYGKYQKGNKISYEELQQYLSKINNRFSFWDQAYPQMKKVATDVIRASAASLDSEKRTNFQIYGLDFMIDEEMKVWLIQVNTNPCLQLSCPLLAKIIPKMLQNTLQICLDPIYPPPTNFNPKGQTFKTNCLEEMDYQLVYDDRFEQTNKSDARLLNDEDLKKQEDDCFQDDGEDWNQD